VFQQARRNSRVNLAFTVDHAFSDSTVSRFGLPSIDARNADFWTAGNRGRPQPLASSLVRSLGTSWPCIEVSVNEAMGGVDRVPSVLIASDMINFEMAG
jgi:hypothetical protein